jgi:hypothetical protein
MKQISLNSKSYQLPETWEEIPKAILPDLLTQLYAMPESGTTYLTLLRLTLGYREREWTKLMAHYFAFKLDETQREANAEVLGEVLRRISWMWKQELTTKPFESITLEGSDRRTVDYLLPEENFLTVSYGELSDAYIHSRAFVEQIVEGEERLNYLLATICRPERKGNYADDSSWNGDKREPYNEHIARSRVKVWEAAPYDKKIIVLMYFLGTLKNFLSLFDIWQGDGAGPAPEDEYPGQSWIKNQHLLAEKHIFGGMIATKAANVHEVFSFLEEHSKDMKQKIALEKAQQKNDSH